MTFGDVPARCAEIYLANRTPSVRQMLPIRLPDLPGGIFSYHRSPATCAVASPMLTYRANVPLWTAMPSKHA